MLNVETITNNYERSRADAQDTSDVAEDWSSFRKCLVSATNRSISVVAQPNLKEFYDFDRTPDQQVRKSAKIIGQTQSDASTSASASTNRHSQKQRGKSSTTNTVADWIAEKQKTTKEIFRRSSDKKKHLKRQDSAPETISRRQQTTPNNADQSPSTVGPPYRKSQSVKRNDYLMPPGDNMKKQQSAVGVRSSPNLIHFDKIGTGGQNCLDPSSASASASSARASSTDDVNRHTFGGGRSFDHLDVSPSTKSKRVSFGNKKISVDTIGGSADGGNNSSVIRTLVRRISGKRLKDHNGTPRDAETFLSANVGNVRLCRNRACESKFCRFFRQ